MEDVYALKKRMQVEISFPVSPFIGLDQLYMHYQRGVLPWDTYVQHACAAAALPHQPMPEPMQPSAESDPLGGQDPKQKKKSNQGNQEGNQEEEEE